MLQRFVKRFLVGCCASALLAILVAACTPARSRAAACVSPPRATEKQASDDKSDPSANTAANGERRFRFIYAATVTGLEAGSYARIWIPLPPTDDVQTVEIARIEMPSSYRFETERKFGNKLVYCEAAANEAGEVPLSIEYLVTRRAVTPAGTPAGDGNRKDFLKGSRKVPVDGSVLKRQFRDRPPRGPTLEVARRLYDQVDRNMRYEKTGEGWGNGDALWACDSGRGNCSDFHSVFIAMCRDLTIPAKFEIGFPLPAERGQGEIAGYHCWAKFLDGDHWMAVDISEADKHPEKKDFFFGNLPSDRVMFSTERDLELMPPQAAGPLNFLIYPYVEVDGKPYAKQTRRFQYEDLNDAGPETQGRRPEK